MNFIKKRIKKFIEKKVRAWLLSFLFEDGIKVG